MASKNKKQFESFDLQKILQNTLLIMVVLGFFFALSYTFNNITFPRGVNVVMMLPFILFLAPYLVWKLYQNKIVDAKMQVVPRFLRDIVDSVESGIDLISSIKASTANEYGVLNPEVKKLSNQLSWGVSFDKAILRFSENIGSKELKRDLLLITEARKVGGHVEQILRELSQKISIDILRKDERKSNLASNTFTGYISFIIFLIIIVLVYNNLFVGLLGSFNENDTSNSSVADQSVSIYLSLFILLAYELAILSGFLFGMMQENSLVSGAPHVVMLVLLTFLVFFFFVANI